MITFQKEDMTDWIDFSLLNVNAEKGVTIIPEYLTKHLKCEVINHSDFVIDFVLDLKRDGIIFRYIYEEGYDFFDFRAPNNKLESPEYYAKLEKIVQELVDALNRDNHILNIAK